MGSHLGLTRMYGRAPRGQRPVGTAPRNRGANRTLIAALTRDGPGPGLLLEGPLTGAAFTAYLTGCLAPTLRPGQIVVVDNVRPHRDDRARQAIEARGAELWFLPTYSPDLNPIEEGFSKLKGILRDLAPRTPDEHRAALWTALEALTAEDAAGWIAHAGYGRRRPRPHPTRAHRRRASRLHPPLRSHRPPPPPPSSTAGVRIRVILRPG